MLILEQHLSGTLGQHPIVGSINVLVVVLCTPQHEGTFALFKPLLSGDCAALTTAAKPQQASYLNTTQFKRCIGPFSEATLLTGADANLTLNVELSQVMCESFWSWHREKLSYLLTSLPSTSHTTWLLTNWLSWWLCFLNLYSSSFGTFQELS